MNDPRIAVTLLGIVYQDLTSLAGTIDEPRQGLRKLQAMLDEQGAAVESQIDNFTALIGELDLPAELMEALREITAWQSASHAQLRETLPIVTGMLDGAIGYIETRQKMIREQGFAPTDG